jgi:hypothetical protein
MVIFLNAYPPFGLALQRSASPAKRGEQIETGEVSPSADRFSLFLITDYADFTDFY